MSIIEKIREKIENLKTWFFELPFVKKRRDKKAESDAKKFISAVPFTRAADEKDLSYHDPFVTEEQKKRDGEVTRLLTAYVDAYEHKMNSSKWYRRFIFCFCMAIVIGFAVMLGWSAIRIFASKTELEASNIIAFITACISFITLIIGILQIITKYFFPENYEQHITEIVKTIQSNDLKKQTRECEVSEEVH